MSAPSRQSQGGSHRHSTPTGILIFDNVEELDFVGPWEVFGVTNETVPGSFPCQLLSTGKTMIRAEHGLPVGPLDSIYDAPTPRLLVIPGGSGRRVAMKDSRLLEQLKRWHAEGTMLASVCTGVFILAATGLLDRRSATTHWAAIDELRTHPAVKVVRRRFVDEGDIVTAAGISAGMDMALYLVSGALGKDVAKRVAHLMEYSPANAVFRPRAGQRGIRARARD